MTRVTAIAIVLLSLSVPAQVIFTLAPTADATTDSARPATNLGADPELSFGKTSTSVAPAAGFRRGHVQFDVTSLTGLVPIRATFFWYQSRSNAAGCLDVSLHRVLAPWSESAITWQNQPPHDAAPVSTTCVGNSFALGWKRFELTTLLQAWIDGSVPNDGFVIRDPNERSAGASRPGFGHSRENGNPTLDPYLEVELADVIGVGCSARALSPSLAVLRGSTQLESSLFVRASNLIPGSNVGGFFGFNPLATPISLASIGFPSCSIWIAPELQAAFASPSGTLDVELIIPDVTTLVGRSIHAQIATITPSFALELTNGLAARIYE